MFGPGRYDTLCGHCRKTAHAKGVILVVMDGSKGTGFSVQGTLEALCRAPAALRMVAQAIEDDLYGKAQKPQKPQKPQNN